jgi:hypothetical protein
MFTLWNYYVLKLLRLETITFSDATLCDINVVLCCVLSQYRLNGQPQSFSPNRSPKMRKNQQICFGLWLVSKIFEEFQNPAIRTKIEQHFGGFFHQIKVSQPVGRHDSIQAVCQRMRRLEAFLYLFSASELRTFSKIQDQNKNIKILPRPIQ